MASKGPWAGSDISENQVRTSVTLGQGLGIGWWGVMWIKRGPLLWLLSLPDSRCDHTTFQHHRFLLSLSSRVTCPWIGVNLGEYSQEAWSLLSLPLPGRLSSQPWPVLKQQLHIVGFLLKCLLNVPLFFFCPRELATKLLAWLVASCWSLEFFLNSTSSGLLPQ